MTAKVEMTGIDYDSVRVGNDYVLDISLVIMTWNLKIFHARKRKSVDHL